MIKVVTLHDGLVAAPLRQALQGCVRPAGAVAWAVARASDCEIPGVPGNPFAGLVESAWFETEAVATAAFGAADANRYFTHENLVVGDPAQRVLPNSVKVMAFIRRRPDLSVGAFQAYWRTRHAALVKDLPHLQRYAQLHLDPRHYASGAQPHFDGVAEIWWPDLAGFEDAWLSPQMKADAADGANYSSKGAYIFVADEVLLD